MIKRLQKVVAVSLDSSCSNAFLSSSARYQVNFVRWMTHLLDTGIYGWKGELQKHWRVCIQLQNPATVLQSASFTSRWWRLYLDCSAQIAAALQSHHHRRTMNHIHGRREAPSQRCREGGLRRVVIKEEFIPDCTRLSASCHSDQASSYDGADHI